MFTFDYQNKFMKPILELLIEDIKYDILEIENTDESEYEKVSEIFINIYKRVDALDRNDFNSDYKYELFESNKKLYRDSGFMLENGIKHGLYSTHKHLQVRLSLESLTTYLFFSQ